jgi:hypothetical protein
VSPPVEYQDALDREIGKLQEHMRNMDACPRMGLSSNLHFSWGEASKFMG